MPEKRLPAIVDRAVWEKITKGRAGIRWGNVVEKIWKKYRGRPRIGTVYREIRRAQDRSKRENRRKGKGSVKK